MFTRKSSHGAEASSSTETPPSSAAGNDEKISRLLGDCIAFCRSTLSRLPSTENPSDDSDTEASPQTMASDATGILKGLQRAFTQISTTSAALATPVTTP